MLMQTEFENQVSKVKEDVDLERIAQEVRAKFQPMFAPEESHDIGKRFKAFLTIGENHHWDKIHRWSGRLTANLPLLKKALLVLVD